MSQNWKYKLSRLAIPNLILYLIILYVVGFIIDLISPGFYEAYLSLNMARILDGQVWRLVTYLACPPSGSLIWMVLLCYIYYSMGNMLERMWGTVYFNLYVFIGLFANVIAALVIYLFGHGLVYELVPDNLYLSFLLAFAFTLPDARFYIFFFIPIRAKVLGIIYCILIAFELMFLPWPSKIAVLASVVNFIIFFTLVKKPIRRVHQAIRFQKFKEAVKAAQPETRQAARHTCAVCGRTDISNPELEFRFCSKCEGNFEYCSEHLYTHAHRTKDIQ